MVSDGSAAALISCARTLSIVSPGKHPAIDIGARTLCQRIVGMATIQPRRNAGSAVRGHCRSCRRGNIRQLILAPARCASALLAWPPSSLVATQVQLCEDIVDRVAGETSGN